VWFAKAIETDEGFQRMLRKADKRMGTDGFSSTDACG
jgi:hypothetical protein